jgi:hypothetical protein
VCVCVCMCVDLPQVQGTRAGEVGTAAEENGDAHVSLWFVCLSRCACVCVFIE